MKSLASIAALLLVTAEAIPAQTRWVHVSANTTLKIRVDTTTAVLKPDNRLTLWLEFQYAKPRPLPTDAKKAFTRSLNRYIIDCAEERIKVIRSLYYSESGDVLDTFDAREESVEWSIVAPETVGETIVGLCNRKSLFDGSYVKARKAWADSMNVLDEVRRTNCSKAQENALKAACTEFMRIEAIPSGKMVPKDWRDFTRVRNVLDSAWLLISPPIPIP